MEPINVKLVLDNLNQQYTNTDLPRRPLSRSERKLLQVLQSKSVRWRNCQAFFNVCLTVVVKEFTTSNYLDFEEFDSLEFEYLGFDDMQPSDEYWDMAEALQQTESNLSGSSQEYQPTPPDVSKDFVPLHYKKKAVNYWLNGGGNKRRFDSVQHSFRLLKRRTELYRWKETVDKQGSRVDKLRMIDDKVLHRFMTSKEMGAITHDADISRFAAEINRDVCLEGFKAANTWVLSFKQRHGIVSR